MNAKVIIENGQTEIVLTPENDFEIDVLEKVYNKQNTIDIKTNVVAKYDFVAHRDHKLIVNLKENKS